MKRTALLTRSPMAHTTLKPKVCAHCGKSFAPARPMQKVCATVRCAKGYLEAEKKVERADTKRRKEAIKTIPRLLHEAQGAFNKWIRARDAALPCISCNAPPPDLSQLHAGRDAGHYRSVGSAGHLRFHEDNVNGQCVKCNQWGAGMAVDYRIGLIARIGLARVEALESNNTVRKWTREELIDKREKYRRKLKELKTANQSGAQD